MKEVYVVWKMNERVASSDAYIINVYENKDTALAEARSLWKRSLQQSMLLEGASNIIEEGERFSEEIGVWRLYIFTPNYRITYKVERQEVIG